MAMHDNRNMLPGYCPICDSATCICKAFGTSTLNTPDIRDQIKTDSVGTFDVHEYLKDKNCTVERDIWNEAIEAAATAMDSIFTEARDTDWDTGYNYCKDNFRNQIRKLKK